MCIQTMAKDGCAELRIAVVVLVEGSQKETVAPHRDSALPTVGQRSAPHDVTVQRDTPLDRRVGGADPPVSVGTCGLRPVGKQKAAAGHSEQNVAHGSKSKVHSFSGAANSTVLPLKQAVARSDVEVSE